MVTLKTYNCIVFTDFQITKLYPFQNLSLRFILKIFLKFCKFQTRYSYNIHVYSCIFYSVSEMALTFFSMVLDLNEFCLISFAPLSFLHTFKL